MRLLLLPAVLVATALAGIAAAASPLVTLQDLSRDLGGTPKLLPPEQAFKVTARVKDAHTLVAEFSPAAAYYLYRNKLQFGLRDTQGTGIATVSLPRGEDRADAAFGHVEVYRRTVVAEIALGRGNAAAHKIVLDAGYQGCSERGVCYAPMTRRFELLLPAVN